MSGDPSLLAEAAALNQQAVALHREGRYAEAESLLNHTLEVYDYALGPDHPYFAKSLDNLASLYRAQGRYTEAESLHKRAATILGAALGLHPDVATSLNNLALLYRARGRYAEAEPLHKRALAIWERALGPDHPNVADTLYSLASLYHEQGRYAEAEPSYKRVLEISARTLGPNDPDVAVSLNNLASLYDARGRRAEAEPLYKRALAIHEKALGPDHPYVAGSLNNLAGLYSAQGRYAEAESLYKRALAIHEKALGPDHPDVAASLSNLAGLYRAQGRYVEAEASFKRALAIREKSFGPDHPNLAIILNNLGALFQDQRRHAEAEPLHKRALAICEKTLSPDHPDVALSLNNLASLYRAQGRYAEAEPLHKRALVLVEKAVGPDHPILAVVLSDLAGLFQEQGRYAEALSTSTRAVALFSKRLSVSFTERAGRVEAEGRTYRRCLINYILLADAVAENEPDRRALLAREAFRVAQMAQTLGAGLTVASMAARFAAGSDALAAVVREHQDLTDRLRRLDVEVVKALSHAPAERNQAEEVSLRASIDDAGRRLDALDARIAAAFPDYAELSNPQPVPADVVQSLLAPDEALALYLSSGQNTWLWVIRRDSVFFARTDIEAEALAAEVAALRARLDPKLNPDLECFPARRAYALYKKILAPATPLLVGAEHLIVVPDGALQSLPLGLLVTQPPERDPTTPGDHRGIAWLARNHAITVLPSVSSLRSLRRHAAASKATAPFFGVGDPVLRGRPGQQRGGIRLASLFRGNVADIEKVRGLEPLPETANELRIIARVMGATEDDLLLGERACEPMIRQTALDRYKVIAFATHGLVSGELEGLAEPALVLTPPDVATPENDGLLTASKIATLKLDADWVVLSACNTAAGDGTPDADGLTGLAKAFFYAGARSLLVSHWPVWSDAAVLLTTGAFAALAHEPSIGRAEAFRLAMMAMLDPSKPAEFAHPQAWGPFVLAGEGGAAR
jgi:tetratricopeptide (TPR) repeat protein/CHAT domain-containing protein